MYKRQGKQYGARRRFDEAVGHRNRRRAPFRSLNELTGGQVERVILHPLTISRTDIAVNPHPLAVVWTGPVMGVAIPLALWAVARTVWLTVAFLFRFFAGFCGLANGLSLGLSSLDQVGDCGDMR